MKKIGGEKEIEGGAYKTLLCFFVNYLLQM